MQILGEQLCEELMALKGQEEFFAVYDCMIHTYPYPQLDFFFATKDEAEKKAIELVCAGKDLLERNELVAWETEDETVFLYPGGYYYLIVLKRNHRNYLEDPQPLNVGRGYWEESVNSAELRFR